MKPGRARFPALIATGLLLLATAVADDDLPYLARIDVERAADQPAPLGDSIRSVLHVDDAELAALSLAAVDGVQVTAIGDNTVSIVATRRPTFSEPPGEMHGRNSFVIDFSEASVQELNQDLRSRYERNPSVDEIVAYVFEHIRKKSYSRAFDFASTVASSGEGDCTEHAVLLAALARANGYLARVAIGTLIVDSESTLYAFGHAWTEVHGESGWQIKDATMPVLGANSASVRYLPISPLQDEGPGYSFSMMQTLYRMPTRISDVANPG